jgi:hypothetical protein
MTSTIPAHFLRSATAQQQRGVDLVSDVLPYGRL